jgi:flagellar hook-basal body complex protein FliE
MVDKIIDPNVALNAYSKTSNIGKNPAAASEEQGVSFSDFLRQKADDSIKALKSGEQMSAKAITGEAGIVDVVQAVGAAEVTLQTVVAVRDRLISAYQEIMRMPI